MRFKRLGALRTAVSGLILALASCEPNVRFVGREAEKEDRDYPEVSLAELMSNKEKYVGKPVTLKGIPLSSGMAIIADGVGSSAIVIRNNESQILLCYGNKSKDESPLKMNVLVQAEIDDGDKEEIIVKGKLTKERTFDIYSVKVEGYEIKELNSAF